MGYRGIAITISIFLSACAHAQLTPSGTPFPSNVWSQVTKPSSGPASPIGFYSNGCIAGAIELPQEGTGYEVMRPFRNRYYGDPELIDFIKNLGITIQALGSGILIGDIGQPRGGPLPYGHASHQMGLDVDIWFWTHPEQTTRSLTLDERNTLQMQTMLNSNGLVDTSRFTQDQIQKLKMASADPRVERIFVNPAIKTYLCATLPVNELPWLHKLRPWPGHDEHFHVRLACPANAKECIHQEPQAPGDGCNELMPPRHQEDLHQMDDEKNENSMSLIIQKIIADPLPATCSKVLRQ